MTEPIPPHFHKFDRIQEKDLVPNGDILSGLPASGQEGQRVVVEDGSGIVRFYQCVKGIWRQIGSTPLTAKGDLLTRDDNSEEALTIGTNNQILIADSQQTKGMKWGNGMVTLNRTATEVNVTSTADETNLYSHTIPGNSIGSNGGLYFLATFALLNNLASNGIVYRLKFGGTEIVAFDSTINVALSANTRYCTLEAWMVSSATNAQQWGGRINIYGAGSQGTLYDVTSTTQRNYIGTIRNNTAVDTVSDQTFAFTHDATSTSASLQTTLNLAALLKF